MRYIKIFSYLNECFCLNKFSLRFFSSIGFLFLLFCLSLSLFIFFTVADLLFVYMFFEFSTLIVFLFILVFGYRINKRKAAIYLISYTIFGSVFFMLGLVIIYMKCFTFDWYLLFSLDLIPFYYKRILYFLFYVPIAIKIPVIPFHVWLPEAHVEASTECSVLLAGLFLKLGFYLLIRFFIPFFHVVYLFFLTIPLTLSCLTIVYISLLMFGQQDLKKLIAYSSILHMNIALLGGLILCDNFGWFGCIYSLFVHGIVSSGLFFLTGCLYLRYRTRLIGYFSGLQMSNPLLNFFFFFFSRCFRFARFW